MSDQTGPARPDMPLDPLSSGHESVSGQSYKPMSPPRRRPTLPGEYSLPRMSNPSSTQDVQLQGIPPNCDASDQTTSEPRPALRESIGRTALMVILGGTVLILASLSFLAFLWFGAGPTYEGRSAPWVWRRIALNGWAPQATTLTALAIQTIVTAQAAVCTSMLAGIVLERGSVPRDKAAHFSILRATSEGPTAIVYAILSSRKLKMIARAEFIMGLLLLLGAAGIQFSTTILLSDMSNTILVGDVAVVPVQSFVAPNQQRITTTQHLYSVMSPAFSIYGEARLNTTVMPNLDGLSDTGVVKRALLPISKSQDRTAIRTYDGGSVVFSSRVACMRPNIQNFEFGQEFWTEHEGSNFGQLNATLDYDMSLKKVGVDDACGSERCPSVPFSCYLAGAYDGYGWQSTFCTMGGVGGSLWELARGPEGTIQNDPWSINSSIFLVFSTNMRNADWKTADQLGIFADGSLTAPLSYEHGEWMSYQLMPDLFVNASVCFQTFSLTYSNVSMVATGDLTEPEVTYDPHTGAIDTDAVQKFFGAAPRRIDPGERRILQVEEIQPWSPDDISDGLALTMNQLKTSIYEEIVVDPGSNTTRLACYHCSCGGVWIFHSEVSQLLGNILNSTARAADMIQTYVSSMAFTVYRQKQKTYAGSEKVAVSSARTVPTAKSCRTLGGCWGFQSVTTLVAIHLVIVILSTASYVTQTRFSRQSNVWHAVAQLASEDIHGILLESGNQSDKAVTQAIEKDSNNYMVKIGKLQGSGKVGVIRHE